MRQKYWIVGGEYTDTRFERLIEGSERPMGPYASREVALGTWRRLAADTKANCHARHTIAEERI
ncbi:MAG: hypothetical protein FJX68_14100 [Alphaproteobacteria bacterium]|nr:hypothetical protein [Alphaproteobacteria bacterium]